MCRKAWEFESPLPHQLGMAPLKNRDSLGFALILSAMERRISSPINAGG
jgi:hypothetical protein